MDRPCTVRAILEVETASQPISGSFIPPDGGEPRPFTGWIELTGAIESMRTATPRPDPRHVDGHRRRVPS